MLNDSSILPDVEELEEVLEGADEDVEEEQDFVVHPEDAESPDNEVDSDDEDEGPQSMSAIIARKRALRSKQGSQSARVAKKSRPNPFPTVEQWISQYDEEHPIPDDDTDVRHFQDCIRALVERICQWARGNGTDQDSIQKWYRLPRTEREMTFAFQHRLAKTDPTQLTDYLLSHTPRQAQRVLGRGMPFK